MAEDFNCPIDLLPACVSSFEKYSMHESIWTMWRKEGTEKKKKTTKGVISGKYSLCTQYKDMPSWNPQ
jgi:hypothetical protein